MGQKLTHTGQFMSKDVSVAISIIHTLLSPSACTHMLNSIELEVGVTTTAMSKEIPNV